MLVYPRVYSHKRWFNLYITKQRKFLFGTLKQVEHLRQQLAIRERELVAVRRSCLDAELESLGEAFYGMKLHR
jgi:hypothetical protein